MYLSEKYPSCVLVRCAPIVPSYASINLLRVDPGYSTHGALQAAQENIVSTFVDEDRYAIVVVTGQAYHERALKVLEEEGEKPPSWLGNLLQCRCLPSTTTISLLLVSLSNFLHRTGQ